MGHHHSCHPGTGPVDIQCKPYLPTSADRGVVELTRNFQYLEDALNGLNAWKMDFV